jgi:hypothetical protein
LYPQFLKDWDSQQLEMIFEYLIKKKNVGEGQFHARVTNSDASEDYGLMRRAGERLWESPGPTRIAFIGCCPIGRWALFEQIYFFGEKNKTLYFMDFKTMTAHTFNSANLKAFIYGSHLSYEPVLV